MDLGIKIAALRNDYKITQEELGNVLGVSRQAVQRWEAGISNPDIVNLAALSEYFDITLDDLVKNKRRDKLPEGDFRFCRRYLPNYSVMHNNLELYSSNIRTEYRQLFDEGKDVSQYEKLVNEISMLPPGKSKEDMSEIICGVMHAAENRSDYPYYEPSEINEIKALRKKTPVKFGAFPDEETLYDKVKGAWLGRICGCLLGKPVEGINPVDLRYLLKKTGNFPLRRYILKSDLTEEILKNCKFPLKEKAYADTIKSAPADDDTNYTVMAGTKLIEFCGKNFQPSDVAHCWLESQPKSAYFTAERIAYLNFINGYFPPVSAIYKNPFREWVGAQIRGDYFGYISPGEPEYAAEMAWRDASVSHVKNGIYGEMFVAAMLACAALNDDIKTVILCGLSEIPHKSRLHFYVSEIIAMHEKGCGYEDCIKYINDCFNQYNIHGWCHAIPNALIVVTALLFGELDYERTVCLAVEACFDTDCNGATAGSVVGMIRGAANIPEKWTAPINNSLETSIFRKEIVFVDDLVKLTLKHMKIKT